MVSSHAYRAGLPSHWIHHSQAEKTISALSQIYCWQRVRLQLPYQVLFLVFGFGKEILSVRCAEVENPSEAGPSERNYTTAPLWQWQVLKWKRTHSWRIDGGRNTSLVYVKLSTLQWGKKSFICKRFFLQRKYGQIYQQINVFRLNKLFKSILKTLSFTGQRTFLRHGSAHCVGDDLPRLCVFARLLGWQATLRCILSTYTQTAAVSTAQPMPQAPQILISFSVLDK